MSDDGLTGEGREKRVLLTDLAAGTAEIEPGTFLQRSGVKIFKWMLWVTSGALVALFLPLFYEVVTAPAVPEMPLAQDTVLLRLVAAQRQAAFDHFVLGVKELIVAVLLPLLTAILGYLFGTRGGSIAQSVSDDATTDA